MLNILKDIKFKRYEVIEGIIENKSIIWTYRLLNFYFVINDNKYRVSILNFFRFKKNNFIQIYRGYNSKIILLITLK